MQDWEQQFENSFISVRINSAPVSLQNKQEKKREFKRKVQETTSTCPYIITNQCWIHIDYYCRNIQRLKNPGAYDIDNIIKPLLDGLSGPKGLFIDDSIIDRVTVNWIDTPHEEHIELVIEYPDLFYQNKANLLIYRDSNNWCWPNSQSGKEVVYDLAMAYLSRWRSVKTEEDYYSVISTLPIQKFLHYNKIKDYGYEFTQVDTAESG